jgi:hypothetical protein
MHRLVFTDELVELYAGDAREIVPQLDHPAATVVIDPPYDDVELWRWSADTFTAHIPARLVFVDPRNLGTVVELFGPCAWIFTWDTGAPWNLGPRRPLTQTRFALFYGELDSYDRDRTLYGDIPRPKHADHRPLDGRRLIDLHRASLRWLHSPEPNARPAGRDSTARFTSRRRHPAYAHAKPVDWIRCLIGNVTPDGGHVLDPFAGSGTTLVAARALGLTATGVELDEEIADEAARRLAGPDETARPQLALDFTSSGDPS